MSDLIDLALREDVSTGDVTVAHFTDPRRQGRARIVAKQAGVIAGIETAAEVFRRVDPGLDVAAARTDGDSLAPGEEVLRIAGALGSILTAERTALNFLQRLSGVATETRRYADAIAGTGCRLLDTRKTTPGFRALEKAAVRAGGGTNHRAGLYDMVMVKDNHLAGGLSREALAGGIAAARKAGLRIEVEADTIEQAREFFATPGIDVVLLDNMPLATMREAVKLRPAHMQLEASGGITLENIRAVAETGVDFVSIGALTHSAPALDLSLEIASHG
ncbi:MAG: carboxylating nicotinate-nucleotide diphosphorylase [Terrimicrobiaceae bacterium]|nr:carboxylating nicotinate-nucleotide diphosphorylase [Terrimicrobiaceae bacterium]